LIIQKYTKSFEGSLYLVFRVFVGLLFVQHGLQKIFGAFGGVDGAGASASLLSQFGLAGMIELIGGFAIALGLFTRLAALIAGVELVVAYFKVHAPMGLYPILNKGEPALLFIAAFLVLIAYGAGKLSLEKALLKKEMF